MGFGASTLGVLAVAATTSVPGTGAVALLAVGLLGASILGRIMDTGDSDDESDESDPLGGDDAFGGMGDDFDLGGDGTDEWADDDPFGEEGGVDESTEELENRLGELETEVSSLSSTVGTVRSENSEISETVDDIAEDVRSLLDVYEMVTRGINPFVDDAPGSFDGAGGTGAAGSFGLFGDAEESADSEEELDDSILSADAEGFFDEELIESDAEDDFGEEVTEEMDTDDGKTFSELKAEYDAGEAEWAEEESDLESESEPAFEPGPEPGPDSFAQNGSAEPNSDPEPAPEPAFESEPGAGQNGANFEFVDGGSLRPANQKPYLTELPGDYVGDLVVMEWLEYLVAESDVTDAARAVNYYERIEWVSPEVAEWLHAFLTGFGSVDKNVVSVPGTDVLGRTHHTRSLKYIMQLNGTTAASVVLDRWDDLSRGEDGA